MKLRLLLIFGLMLALLAGCGQGNESQKAQDSGQKQEASAEPATMTITDMLGRQVTVPVHPESVICSGPGSLRYLTYLQALDRAVAVDSAEKRDRPIEFRPYYLVNPQLSDLPLFGQFRGHDNPELIAGLDPQPQVIFKTYPTMGHDPEELQAKTGIPVVALDYGDLNHRRPEMNAAIRLMAKVLGTEERAEEVIGFIDATVADLKKRTDNAAQPPSCYVGGISSKGPHGFRSTEPGYPPFAFLGIQNVAAPTDGSKPRRHADVAKESIVQWNPEILFVDLGTIRAGAEANAVYELKTDEAYAVLDAVKSENIYGVLPYNSYTSNHGNTLSDAYFIGKTLFPEQFKDVEPARKADEIYTFLVGGPAFEKLQRSVGGLAFTRLSPRVIDIDDAGKVLSK